jgi:hypothetical protein
MKTSHTNIGTREVIIENWIPYFVYFLKMLRLSGTTTSRLLLLVSRALCKGPGFRNSLSTNTETVLDAGKKVSLKITQRNQSILWKSSVSRPLTYRLRFSGSKYRIPGASETMANTHMTARWYNALHWNWCLSSYLINRMQNKLDIKKAKTICCTVICSSNVWRHQDV